MSVSRPARLALASLLLAVLFGLLAVGGLTLFCAGQRLPPRASIPALAVLPSFTPGKKAPVQPAASPTVQRATLPPTWTMTPTRAPSPVPLATSTSQAATPPPALNPETLARTYWEGDGSGSMWDYQAEDGGFMRFTVLPVNIWVGTAGGVTLTAAHETAIEEALGQVAQVVPVQRVTNRGFAHLTVWLMSDADFERSARCPTTHLAIGCAAPVFTEVGILLNTIWLRVTDQHFAATLLHEITHGLGILVHSPDPADLMYAYQTGQPARYSARDLDTLRALYSAPAFAPRGR